MHERRFLPSISLLAAFEAVARTGSVTLAARELNLTQSAVSRQIRLLEEKLGVDLFLRERQTVKLTLAGDGYAREIREALRRISNASLNLRANPRGGTLNLAVPATFGARWLAPRLAGFLRENSGIIVNLVTRFTPFDFRTDSIDAAIHVGSAQWPDAQLDLLMAEKVQPVCSPQFRRECYVSSAAQLLDQPLLHLNSRPDAWERWFIHQGVSFQSLHGMLFDEFTIMAQAAAAGLGIALLPTFLIAEELERGQLVSIVDGEIESAEKYYLAYRAERADYPPLSAFRKWIISEAGIAD
ncbi:LysR substrate-binding domain-containing protein [Oryzifoliimicrobium ureilyticus]|uniref:LysR substrate-binding domain-containing protein n=1 Tax=Oryzifoliimicrobium ureilyticus TaxID=3113724 RepID=UPI0030766202